MYKNEEFYYSIQTTKCKNEGSSMEVFELPWILIFPKFPINPSKNTLSNTTRKPYFFFVANIFIHMLWWYIGRNYKFQICEGKKKLILKVQSLNWQVLQYLNPLGIGLTRISQMSWFSPSKIKKQLVNYYCWCLNFDIILSSWCILTIFTS